jgi:hypothetical protein
MASIPSPLEETIGVHRRAGTTSGKVDDCGSTTTTRTTTCPFLERR